MVQVIHTMLVSVLSNLLERVRILVPLDSVTTTTSVTNRILIVCRSRPCAKRRKFCFATDCSTDKQVRCWSLARHASDSMLADASSDSAYQDPFGPTLRI